MQVSTAKWDKRNIWVLPSGEWVVRPAFSHLVDGGLEIYTGDIRSCQTIRNPRTNEVFHYIVKVESDNTYTINIQNESFGGLQQISISRTPVTGTASIVTLGDEVMIFSPDFPPYWGVIGSGMVPAVAQDSVNEINTSSLDIIPGWIAVSWAGRLAVAENNRLYFSDPLRPRTYVSGNIIDPPGGFIYGMHVTESGALVIVTSEGVWSLPEEASATGQIVIGIWQKLTDYSANNYNQSCITRGRLFGLTERGYRLIDREDSPEVLLDDRVMSRSDQFGRMAFPDYREGRIYGARFGPIVTISRFMHWTDLTTKLTSWMTPTMVFDGSISYNLRGLLYDSDGTEMYAITDGVVRALGNRNDGEDSQEPTAGKTYATLAGRIQANPAEGYRIRRVTFASDTQDPIQLAVNGLVMSRTAKVYHPQMQVDSWDQASLVWIEPPTSSRRFNFNGPKGDEMTFELIFTNHPSKIPQILDVEFKGPGNKRPTR